MRHLTLTSAQILGQLDAAPLRDGVQSIAVELTTGEASWHPASTRSTGRYVYGPCRIVYTRHADGGIVAQVFDPS